MKQDVLDMIETCFCSEITNKVYYYLDKVVVYLENGQKAKITVRSYKGE